MRTFDRSQAEDLLYTEARLLDEGRYTDWLAMLTDDVVYRIPCNGSGGDPQGEISIVYDDRARLGDRIERLGTGVAHAQSPPSKTRRLVSNVQVEEVGDGVARVVSAFILYELRRKHDRVFAGRYDHQLRFVDGRWKIAGKKAVLVNNDEVIDNLTFIV
jgi:benzoate/toluate 1,2-dioxygenase beta subunit